MNRGPSISKAPKIFCQGAGDPSSDSHHPERAHQLGVLGVALQDWGSSQGAGLLGGGKITMGFSVEGL